MLKSGTIKSTILGLLSLTALALADGSSWADVVELANGGRVEGTVLDDASNDATLAIETATGGRMELPRSEVVRVVESSGIQAEYELLARSAPDTVDAQWKLVQWCRDRKMTEQSKQHLARVLELDPDHQEARQMMGYRDVGGDWMTRDELMAARGLVEYEGKWRTRQHVELMEREKQLREATSDWSNRLERWRRWLTSRRQDRAQEARDEILAINDPLAAEPLVAMLEREDVYDLRRLWIQVAAQLDHPVALNALVQLSLYDPDESIRVECLEYVIKSRYPGIVSPYIRALRNKDNEIINRAGAALGQIGDRDAIGPLIEVLVTKHRVVLDPGSSQQNAYSFSPNGGSYNFGSSGPKIETRSVKNPAVLSALVQLSGGTSFDYNQPQWRAWQAAQAKLNMVDVRRDE